MSLGANGKLRFGDYELDSSAGKLYNRDGSPVKLQPQPFRVLTILLERPGEIVSREYLRDRVWGEATFVEFDQGLNYCIRQVRVALGDGAAEPIYIETLPKQGYRFIAPVSGATLNGEAAAAQVLAPSPPPQNRKWIFAAVAGVSLAIACGSIYAFLRTRPATVRYTPLTDFTDSATAPALSPDGRMVAFIRGSKAFLSADQIYVKMLPNGEPRRLTDDPRLKYNLAFSPDGSQIAFSVLQSPDWATYTVPVLGGETRLFMDHAAGLSWLDQRHLLFSVIRTGQHLGVVTGTETREGLREIYFPPHERAMAHYSYPSPDHRWALVVEMNERGGWAPCRLISMDAKSPPRPIGPEGACRSAGWSPDGSWMYFTAATDAQSHLWRQRFPSGQPEQITSGPTEEEGIAVERDGRSIITSLGVHESTIWIHDEHGERSMSSEGEVIAHPPPTFIADGKTLYYLLRRTTAGSGPELWRINAASGASEAVFPGVSITGYDVSPDGKQVVYSTGTGGHASQLWIAPVDREAPPKRIGDSGETSPHFGLDGKILFSVSDENVNYLERMNPDGSGRSKVFDYPINEVEAISPGRRWVMAVLSQKNGKGVEQVAIPTDGGPVRLLCASFCLPKWSPNGSFLFIPVEQQSRQSPGRSLAIPVGPGETLPEFPPSGIEPGSGANAIPGAQAIERAELVPGNDLLHFAYVNTTVRSNLYRISLP
jgi:DNA-binding winged helix-turn-helix (wHTH) protein/Tol biopolymer transport system component